MASPGLRSRRGASVNFHAATIGRMESVDDRCQRGLSCPVLANDAVDRTGRYVQVHIVIGQHGTEAFRDAVQADCRAAGLLQRRRSERDKDGPQSGQFESLM